MPRKKPTNIGHMPADKVTDPTIQGTVPTADSIPPSLPEKLLRADPDGSEYAGDPEQEAVRPMLNEAEAARVIEAIKADEEAEDKALALTVEELMNGISMALNHMAAGTTQAEAARLAAEEIKGEKVDRQ